MKNRPLFLLRQTLQLALWIRAGGVVLASTKPRFIGWTARWWNAFPLLQSPLVESFTPLQLMLGIAHRKFRLVCGCSVMETNLMKLQMSSSCTEFASRGSSELGSECCNRGQTIFTRYALSALGGTRSVRLYDLALRGWDNVAPRCFHFTITAVTVDQGISSSRR